ncbi:MAG: vanadium-dependent haloperoxidase [Gaiellaceae bacterium]
MRLFGLIAVLAVTATIAAASGRTQLASGQAAPPDVAVTHWSSIAAAPLTALPAAPAILGMAMVHGAIYDAVNAIDGGHQPYLPQPPASPAASLAAAVAAAGYNVLLGLPATIPPLTLPASLASDYAAALALVPDGAAKTDGIAAGEAAAAAMLAARASDGRYGPFRFTAGTSVGQWRPEPSTQVGDPNAWLKDVTPFAIGDPARYGTLGPDDLTSKKYAEDFNEVKALGRKVDSSRTTAQTELANFWAVNPPRLWSGIMRTLATQQALSTVDSARYYALSFMAASDTLISVWTDKARWSSWRPVTAIREAENDGNPATTLDLDWQPFLATPPYPDQPSGHTSLATAITMTAQRFFNTDKIAFDATNQMLYAPGTTTPTTLTSTRTFTSLSQARDEVVEARILQGIHFRRADEGGVAIGKDVTSFVDSHLFKTVGDEAGSD